MRLLRGSVFPSFHPMVPRNSNVGCWGLNGVLGAGFHEPARDRGAEKNDVAANAAAGASASYCTDAFAYLPLNCGVIAGSFLR